MANLPTQIDKKIERSLLKEIIRKTLTVQEDPNYILNEFDRLVKSHENAKGAKKTEIKKQVDETAVQALNVLGIETHYPIVETLTRNRTFILELTNQIIDEYKCVSPSEITLAEIMAGSYGRLIEYSKLFNNCQRLDYLSHEKNGYYSMLSKEVDRANRHYLSALSLLRDIKSPPIKINIKTNTAFVAQNQQVNNTPYENNNP